MKYIDLARLLAKSIFVSGISLSIVEHPPWRELFKKFRLSYEPPSRKEISTKFLDLAYINIKSEIQSSLATSKVLHLQCDWWSNIRNEENFVITNPKPHFVEFL